MSCEKESFLSDDLRQGDKLLPNKKDYVDGAVIFKGIDRSKENEEYLVRFVYLDGSGEKKQTIVTRFKLK